MSRIPLYALLASVACGASGGAQAIAGTYAVWLCDKECAVADTSTAAVVAGYLVLFDKPLPADALKSARSRELLDDSMFLLGSYEKPNACFVLYRRTKELQLLAGIIPAGFTRWKSVSDTLVTTLYASPDAFFDLRGVITEGRLLSTSREHGHIFVPFDKAAGLTHGVRIGPPDLQRCLVPAPSDVRGRSRSRSRVPR